MSYLDIAEQALKRLRASKGDSEEVPTAVESLLSGAQEAQEAQKVPSLFTRLFYVVRSGEPMTLALIAERVGEPTEVLEAVLRGWESREWVAEMDGVWWFTWSGLEAMRDAIAVAQAVEEHGWALCWLESISETVAFVHDEAHRSRVPLGIPSFSIEELETLYMSRPSGPVPWSLLIEGKKAAPEAQVQREK